MNMLEIDVEHELININFPDALQVDVKFGACRTNPNLAINFFDVVDFSKRCIERWSIPSVKIPNTIEYVNSMIADKDLTVSKEFYLKELSTTHVVQVSPSGILFINRGNFYNGTVITIIDTNNNKAFNFPNDYDTNPMLYTATGGFSSDYKYWYFVRWPLEDGLLIIKGEKHSTICEVGRISVDTLEYEHVCKIEAEDEIHQITCSPDGRFLVFTSFKSILNVPYPDTSWKEDCDSYKNSHKGGIKRQSVVTIDIETGKNWKTEVMIPVSAHMEFDPNDSTAFYVSSHNFALNKATEVILEGPGAITKMRIMDNKTVIEGVYTDKHFYRLSQHVPFTYQDRTLIAVTNIPNKLDFIDGATMSLWRQASFFEAGVLNFESTGSVVSPGYEKAFYSINPSQDGSYVVLESEKNFHIYDVSNDVFLEFSVDRCIVKGAHGTGHTRLVGR
jgi:hypothetical protein